MEPVLKHTEDVILTRFCILLTSWFIDKMLRLCLHTGLKL